MIKLFYLLIPFLLLSCLSNEEKTSVKKKASNESSDESSSGAQVDHSLEHTLSWAVQFGASTLIRQDNPSIYNNSGYDSFSGIVFNNDGGLTIGGHTAHIAETNGDGTTSGSNKEDILLFSMDAELSNTDPVINWFKQVGNVTDSANATLGDLSYLESCAFLLKDSTGSFYCINNAMRSIETSITTGVRDIFVMKFNSAGEYQWVKQFGTNQKLVPSSVSPPSNYNDTNDHVSSVAIDSNDKIYVCGYTNGSVADVQGNPGSSMDSDSIIFSLDTDGNVLWSEQFGQSYNNSSNVFDQCNGIVTNSNDEVFIAGMTSWVIEGSSTFGGVKDAYLAKLNTEPNAAQRVAWYKHLGPDIINNPIISPNGRATNNTEYVSDLAIDNEDNLIIVGSTDSSLADTLGGTNQFASYYGDIFALKFNSSGSLLWGQQFGTNSISGSFSNDDGEYFAQVVIDSYNMVYIVFLTSGSSFGDTHAGLSDLVISKIHADDGAHLWFKHFGGQNTLGSGDNTGSLFLGDVKIDINNSLYIVGNTTPGTGIGMIEASGGSTDLNKDGFVLKFSPPDQ